MLKIGFNYSHSIVALAFGDMLQYTRFTLDNKLFFHISRSSTFANLFNETSYQQIFQCAFDGRFADVRT